MIYFSTCNPPVLTLPNVEKTNVINMSFINVGFIYTKLAHTSKIHSIIVDELLDINNINIE